MARPINKLAPETVELTEGVGGWAVSTNATIAREPHFHPYYIPFSSTTQGNSLRVRPIIASDSVVRTEGQSIAVSTPIKGSVWVTGTSEISVEIELHVLDSGAGDVSPDPVTQTIPADAWVLLDVEAISDSDASSAYLQITFTSPSAGDTFWIAQPTMVELTAISTFISRAYNTLPDYLIEGDKSISSVPTLPLLRFMALGGRLADTIADDMIDFDYLRPTDAEDGVGYLSLLGDPQNARAEWLGWLANQVGVRLHLPDGGFTTWAEFVEANIRNWDHWSGDGPSNPFLGMDSYDPAAVQGILDDFRRQIEFGTNGIMSSSLDTLSDYIGSLLQQIDPTPWVFIRKRYKDNPWKVGVVVKEGADPGGTLLEKAAMTATPAGIKPYILYNASRTAKVLYSVEEFADRMEASGIPANAGTRRMPFELTEDGSTMKFVQDEMMTGRNLVVFDYPTGNNWIQGGGIGLAKYFDGHALYAGGVSVVTSPATVGLDIDADIDVRLLVSDMKVSSGSNRLLMSSDHSGTGTKWEFSVDVTTGYLRFKWWEEPSGTQEKVSTVAPNWDLPDPMWLRVTLDADNGSSDADLTFWTKSVEGVEWVQLGDVLTVGATTSIENGNPGDFGTIQILDYSDIDNGGIQCIIYWAQVYDGIDGTLQFNMNLTDTSNATIKTGTTTLTETGPDAVTCALFELVDGDTYYVPKYTLLHNHYGTDYFYFGRSPYAHDSGNTPNAGDTLEVDMGSSNTYYWHIEYVDGTNTENNETTQIITWDSDDYGGSSIEWIGVRTGSQGGSLVGYFVPSLVAAYENNGDTADGVDAYGKTWTLTRAMEESEYYEMSYEVDRPSINIIEPDAKIRLGGFGLGSDWRSFKHGPQSYVAVYRHWSPNALTHMFDTVVTPGADMSGVQLGYSGTTIKALASSGLRTYPLSYNESARMGEWNMLVLRMSPAEDAVEMIHNGVVRDSADSYFADQYAFLPHATNDYISIPHATDFNMSPKLWIQVKFYPDGPWDAGTYEIAKKWGGAGARSWRIRLVNGDFEFVHSSDGTNIADVYTYTVADPGHAIWFNLYFDGDYNASTERAWFLYAVWNDELQLASFLDSDVLSGTSTIFASNDPIEIGTSFVGRVYGIRMDVGATQLGVLDTQFQDLTQWTPADTSATGNSGNTISLVGDAHIARSPLTDSYPSAVSDVALVNNTQGSSYIRTTHFAALGVFDHYLTDDEIDDLMTEYNIT